jgi:hypothetical protein
VQPKLNTALASETLTTGGAEEASIRQLLSNGKSKTALDRAKELHKKLNSASSESLLIDAYSGRIQSLLDQDLTLEAKSLLDLVRSRYPSAKARLDRLSAISAARAGALDELIAPLADPALASEHRAAIESAVQNTVADLPALATCAALPADHALRIAAAALDRAFAAATSGPVTDEQIALPEVSHRSPLGPWKLLVRAIAHIYRGEDDSCRECLALIKPESVPARLIPAMHSMLDDQPVAPPAPADAALLSRTIESTATLRSHLEKLDLAFADEASESQIFKLVRLAMQACRRIQPEQMETLKRLIWVRGAGADLDPERMTAALQGMPRQDASFFRALAHGMETSGDPEGLAMACETWDDFRQQAVREGWFGDKGIEVATLYLHMAGLLRKIPQEMLAGLQQEARPGRKVAGEEVYFLFPERLYERACFFDPHAENFSKWLSWANTQSGRHGDDVAKAWNKLRPGDIEPLLYLLQEAEKRGAFPSALKYLEQAERIDAVHSVVRASRLRLLAGSAIRHLQLKKPHLAAEKLQAIAELPQSRQGDRPAFLAALANAIAIERGDAKAQAETGAEAERLLGSDIAVTMLVCGILNAAKRQSIFPPPVQKLSGANRLALPASIARVAAIAKDLGLADFKLPGAYLDEAAKQFPLAKDSFDVTQLRTLADAALAEQTVRFAYAVSTEGLKRGSPTEAWFLLVRARSLPKWPGARPVVCASAAAEFARAHHDMETLGEAVDLVRDISGPNPLSLTLEQAGEVVRTEIAASAYPSMDKAGPDYAALISDWCDCPDCRRARGETPDFFDDDDDDDDFVGGDLDEEKMEEMFNSRVPPDMSPEIAKMLFTVMKEAYLNGVPPDELLATLQDMTGSDGKRKKGKRK